MTPDDMEAGPEINAAVAEVVTNVISCKHWSIFHAGAGSYRKNETCDHEHCVPKAFWPPDYSTSNAAAHEALEKMDHWSATTFEREDGTRAIWIRVEHNDKSGYASASTFALAASRAMLKAEGWVG